jgi:RpiB/LacA/LacB family sugar-phosphate isomerase
MILAIGADHGGFPLKSKIAALLTENGHSLHDLGTHSEAPVDYPDYVRAVAAEVRAGRAERGILICGSGVGACMAANKFPGIRAALSHDSYSARQGVEHDNANILCLGARVVGDELARDLVRIWLASSYSGAERHNRRLAKVTLIEREFSRC